MYPYAKTCFASFSSIMADAAALFKAGFFLARRGKSCYDGRKLPVGGRTDESEGAKRAAAGGSSPDRTAISKVYGCYVSSSRQIISYVDAPLGLLSQEEQEMYLNLLKKSLSGALGRNLIDIEFSTRQVADSDEHRLLQTRGRRSSRTPMPGKACTAGSSMPSTWARAAISPPGRRHLRRASPQPGRSGGARRVGHGVPVFRVRHLPGEGPHPGFAVQRPGQGVPGQLHRTHCSPPVLGFLFPAFDDRSANIYNALFYSKDTAQLHQEVIDAVFCIQNAPCRLRSSRMCSPPL